MKSNLIAGGLFAVALSTSAFAASTTMSAPPADVVSVTMYYKANVYDPKENKIGEIDDVLLDRSGKINGFVVGVGGFLGIGEKDVVVPFEAVKVMHKDHTASTARTNTAANNAANNANSSAAPATNPPPANTTTTTSADHATANRSANANNSDSWLAIDETKDSLKAAPGVTYDRTTMTWKAASK